MCLKSIDTIVQKYFTNYKLIVEIELLNQGKQINQQYR